MRLWYFNTRTLLVMACLGAILITSFGGQPTFSQAQENIVLTLAVPNIWEDVLTDEVLAQFTAENPGVTVNVEYTGNNFILETRGDITNRFETTEEKVYAGDVIYVDSSSLYVEATQAGYFLDLAPLVNSDASLNTADFFPAVWQSYQWNGGVWALPISTDVIVVTYDPAAFDAAGLAYPNERWTIADFDNAARQLTQYNADGTVAVPGMSTISGGDTTDIFLRSLLTSGLYDVNTFPNNPKLNDPALESILNTWYQMQTDGVVMTATSFGNADTEDVPLLIGGRFSYGGFNFGRGSEATTTVRYASLLPNNTAGLDVQALAVSGGTLYPEQAYALARFLTTLPNLSTGFTSVLPARQSMVGQTQTQGGQGGPGGPGGLNVPAEIQPVIDQAVQVALPISEMRYTNYLVDAADEMINSGTDALTALQNAEAQAITNSQTAIGTRDTLAISVATPEPTPVIAAGEIELKFGYQSGFGGGPGGGQIANEDEWKTVINNFSASNPVVGNVTLDAIEGTNLANLTQEYDCFVLGSNVVQGNDLSTLLNLDPLLDADPTFDRNDVLGNTLSQLQQDNRTWAIPLAIQPQMLSYNTDLFAQAGIPAPTNGWTTDAFIDALQRLQPYMTEDTAAFNPNDPTGAYLSMLIAAFGGTPLDYSTTPPTANFTDPATLAAIQQVLDLAKNGYIEYSSLAATGGMRIFINGDSAVGITTNTLSRFMPPGGPNQLNQSVMASAFYPSGSQSNVMAYEITTGYISATAQNPEACYQWLTTLSQNPQLFSGMPARRSLLNDPTVQASQDPSLVAIYQQFDALLQAPNTVIVPVTSLGGSGAANFVAEYWLKQAYDRYVLEDADLAAELATAQSYTQAYLECSAAVSSSNDGDMESQRAVFEQLNQCAANVDPSFSLFG